MERERPRTATLKRDARVSADPRAKCTPIGDPFRDSKPLDLPGEHVRRYRYAQEWFDLVNKIWTSDGKFDWDGEFFKVKNCYGNPKPWHRERLPIINAAGSGEGRRFALRNADFLFTPAIDLSRSKPEIRELKDQANAVGRAVEVLTFAMSSAGRPSRRRRTIGSILPTPTRIGQPWTT